jgi:arsenite methyltransferase
MQSGEEIKNVVREKYAEIAVASESCGCSCCGTGSGATMDYTIMSEDSSKLEGYVPDADLGLGCGLPTEYAGIKEGDTVLDLGSGAGNDVFIARRVVGAAGKVLGLDFTDEMIAKARRNCDTLGYNNVEFRKGDIEHMPVNSGTVDVVVSNCVLNLVPDKKQAFAEILRVLKGGGHFCVSDIVLRGELPMKLQNAAAMVTGCVAGAVQMEEYIGIIRDAGFTDIAVAKEKTIVIPDDILLQFITTEELQRLKASGTAILSITISATRPR